MKILKFHLRILKIMKNLRIPCADYENHENVEFNLRIMKIMKILEFHLSMCKNMKKY